MWPSKHVSQLAGAGYRIGKGPSGYFQQAVALDSNYALAYVGLSSTYRALVADSAIDPKEFTPKAEAAVQEGARDQRDTRRRPRRAGKPFAR